MRETKVRRTITKARPFAVIDGNERRRMEKPWRMTTHKSALIKCHYYFFHSVSIFEKEWMEGEAEGVVVENPNHQH